MRGVAIALGPRLELGDSQITPPFQTGLRRLETNPRGDADGGAGRGDYGLSNECCGYAKKRIE
jgi:hypothetical protein